MDLQSILQPVSGPAFSATPPSSIATTMDPSPGITYNPSSYSLRNNTSAPVQPVSNTVSSHPISTTSSHPPPHISSLISSPDYTHPLTPLSAVYHPHPTYSLVTNSLPCSYYAPAAPTSSSVPASARHPISNISNLVNHSPPSQSDFPSDQHVRSRASPPLPSKGEQNCSISPILNPTNRSPSKTPNSYPAYSNPSLPASPPSVTSSTDQHPREFTKKRSLSDEDVAWQLIRLGGTSSSDQRNSDSTAQVPSTKINHEFPNSKKLAHMSRSDPLIDPHRHDLSSDDSAHSFSKRRRSDNNSKYSNSHSFSVFHQLTSKHMEDTKELPTSKRSDNLSDSYTNAGSFPSYFDSSSFSKSRCSRCRRSKKGCDRQRPCGRCRDAGLNLDECVSDDEPSNVGRRKSKGRGRGRPKTRN